MEIAMRRLPFLPLAVLLSAALMFLPACKKKNAGGGGDGPEPAAGPGPVVPPSVSSGHLLYAHVNVKDIRDGAIFTEVKQAFAKAGGAVEWDKIEGQFSKEIGVKPTEIDSVTAMVVAFTPQGRANYVIIVKGTKPLPKSGAFGLAPNAKPDARGFYTQGRDELIHFPNDKTLVMLSAALSQQYLDGYAKNSSGWPLSAELTKAATGHTAFVSIQMDKLPVEARNAPDLKEFAPLMAAKTVTLTADLKGKELSVAGRATFPDAASAGKARQIGQKFIGMAVSGIEKFLNGKIDPELAVVLPAVKEAHRAIKEAKLEVSGSDLTLTGRYKADFDITTMVTEGIKVYRETAPRITAQNSLKQIGISLHAYHDANNRLLVHGTGANGTALKNATDKPLLSWRVAILPYIEQGELYKQFKLNEPWDSEHNKKLIEKMPKIFESVSKPGKAGYTHLQMVIGPGAMTPGKYNIGNIPDGTSNTVAVIEAVDPVIWTKPDDVMLPAKLAPGELKKKFGGQFPNGFNVLMWDGSVRFVSDAVKEGTLRLAVCPDDGQVLPSDWANPPQK
jgi:prepilin-type processing-associated H-X9-DG protein